MKTKIIVYSSGQGHSAVHIKASGKDVFKKLLGSFKDAVPAKYRSYMEGLQSWSVTAGGSSALALWLADARVRRFEIIREELTATAPGSLEDEIAQTLRQVQGLLREVDEE